MRVTELFEMETGNWFFYNEPRQYAVGRGERTGQWKLYDMEKDRTELKNVIDEHPDRVRQMIDGYHRWANRVGVLDWEEINCCTGRL